MVDAWIQREITDGIVRLLTLSLDRTPAHDTIEGTIHTWGESLSEGRVWDEQRDAWRFRAAFRRLAREAVRWPTPSQFLTMLPAAKPLAALAKPKPNPEVAKAAMAEALEVLNAVPPGEERTYRRPMTNPLSAAARQLLADLDSRGKHEGDQGLQHHGRGEEAGG